VALISEAFFAPLYKRRKLSCGIGLAKLLSGKFLQPSGEPYLRR
jgi:hypothetical protein